MLLFFVISDIDECVEQRIITETVTIGNETSTVERSVSMHECDADTNAMCRNEIGGYRCNCNNGYLINGDGKACAG